MSARLITCWATEVHTGRCTLVKQVSASLTDHPETVLIVTIGTGRPHSSDSSLPNPAEWVPRFSSLSPVLLRNYLAGTPVSFAHLHLQSWPPVPVIKELVVLIKKAFEWIWVLGPAEESSEAIVLLEASDILLWVARPGSSSENVLKGHLERLAALHFPNALSHVILNRVPKGSRETEMPSGKPLLECLPEDPTLGLEFQDGIARLARRLQTQTDLYLPKKVDLGPLVNGETKEKTIQEIKDRLQPQLLEAMNQKNTPTIEMAQKTLETCLAEDTAVAGSRAEREQLFNRVLEDVLGLGPLEPLLKDPDVSEVMVNGKDAIFYEKRGRLHSSSIRFSNDTQLRTIIDRIVAPIGRRVDESMPLCDARLADGSRVNIVIPPLALDGPVITIRKFMSKALGFEDMVRFQSLTQAMADFLKTCVLRRKNIVVSGGTGSGKTTLLNALSGLIPDDERIVTIEDAAELRLQKPHVVRLESRAPNAEGEGAIPIRRLVINALRMRPDRIVVGECRGGEALDMLQAMNTGHDGSLTTVHANTPRDALGRLETLVLMAGLDLPVKVVREQIRSAVHVIIQQARLADGTRKIVSITEVTGMEGDTLTTQEIFRFRQGAFESTGVLGLQ